MICQRRTTVRTAPRRGKPIPEGFVRQLGDAHWELRILRELKSPNKTYWAHWRLKQADRQAWEVAIELAIAKFGGMEVAAGAQILRRAGLSLFVGRDAKRQLVKERRRVTVHRLVPSLRNFIKDDDNLAFAIKPLCDALKRVGLIYEDKREYLDAPRPSQAVSPDGIYTTVIEIQRLGVGPATHAPATPAGGLLS